MSAWVNARCIPRSWWACWQPGPETGHGHLWQPLCASSPVCPSVLQAVGRINAAVHRGMPAETLEALMDPAAQLPDVHAPAAPLYQHQLALLQCQHPRVSDPRGWAMGPLDTGWVGASAGTAVLPLLLLP